MSIEVLLFAYPYAVATHISIGYEKSTSNEEKLVS
jgi:hypothetical protein